MPRQKLTERNAITTALESSIQHVVNNGTSYKITKANYQKALTSGFVGSLAIADTPTVDGIYICEEAGTYTNAGSLVVSLTDKIAFIVVGATQTTFELIEVDLTADSAFANVKLYGATGDGVADDTAEIQLAIDNADLKPVIIPPGTYLISATLDLPSNCEIINYGTIKRDTGVAAFDMLEGDSVDNVIIRGGKIDGVTLLDESVAANRFCGIRIWDSSTVAPCNNILIENVEITNTTHGEQQAEGNRGAIALEDVINGTVQNCNIHTNRGTSIIVLGSSTKDCKILDNHLHSNDTIGSAITGNGYTGLIVQGNHCYDTLYTAISVNGKNSQIIGNIVYGAPDNYAGITIGHPSAVSNASGTSCIGNTVRDCGTTTAFVGGIVVQNSDDVILQGNTIKDNSNHGIKFLNDVFDSTGRCNVQGNIINNNAGNGIYMEWGEDHVIQGNSFISNTKTGLYVDGAKDYTLNNLEIKTNLFKDNGGTTAYGGIVVSNPTSGGLLVKAYGNTFEGTGTLQNFGLWAAGSNVTIQVKDNDFDSSYTEALAYKITSSGTITYKQTRAEPVTLVTGGALLNSWTAVSSLGYWKDNSGMVHLQGGATGGTVSTAAFTLPVGYRPSASQTFVTVANNLHAIALVSSSTGDVTLYTSNTNHYVNTISFRAVNSDAS